MQGLSKQVLVSTLFFATVSMCGAANASSFYPDGFPYLPRLTLAGLAGNNTFGTGEAMIPLSGNLNGIFYADVQGKGGNDDGWLGSVGGGYRGVSCGSNILGGYLFVDRNETENHNAFWMLSPGFESLGNRWDFRVNGYIPVSSRRVYDHSAYGDQLGLGQYVSFSGHNQYDRLFNFYEEVGPGADGEIGRIFPSLNRLAIYGGGYFFNLQNTSNIKGVEGRAELPLTNHFTVLVNDTYDNSQHNTIAAGLRVSVGGTTNKPLRSCFDIHQRMLDPIQRNLGALSTGSGVPSEIVRDQGTQVLQRSNIWFFKSDAVGGSNAIGCGTYDNPCLGSQFTQATIDAINTTAPNANFYFNSGAYPLNGRISLNQGQSMFGRTADYRLPAQNAARPVFTGGIDLGGGNNTLDSFQLFNNAGAQTSGLDISNGATNVGINNLLIGANDTQSGYRAAVVIHDAQNIVIGNSTISGFAEDPTNAFAVGIQMDDNSSLKVSDSTVNATANLQGAGGVSGSSFAVGINEFLHSNLSVTNSKINATSTATGTLDNMSGVAQGISVGGGSTANVAGSTINAAANILGTGLTLNGTSLGITTFTDSTVNLNNDFVNAASNVNGNSTNITSSTAIGVNGTDNSTLNIANSNIYANANIKGNAGDQATASSRGVFSTDTALTLKNSIVGSNSFIMGNSDFSGSLATGIDILGGSANISFSDITAKSGLVGSGTILTSFANGIFANQANVSVDHCNISAAAKVFARGQNVSVNSDAIQASQSNITVSNSAAKANAMGVAKAQQLVVSAAGLDLFDHVIANVFNSNIDANSFAGGPTDSISDFAGGVLAKDNTNITITNADINAYATAYSKQFTNMSVQTTGIEVFSNSTLQLMNSNVIAKATAISKNKAGGNNVSSNATGLEVLFGSNATVQQSNVNAAAQVFGTGDDLEATAMGVNSNDATVNIVDSFINANALVAGSATTGTGGISANATGVNAFDSTVNIQNSNVQAATWIIGKANDVIQANATGVSVGNGSALTVVDSCIHASAAAVGHALHAISTNAVGMFVTRNSTATISDSNISAGALTAGTAESVTAGAVGVFANRDSVVNVTDSKIASNALVLSNGTALNQQAGTDGIFANTRSTINISGSFIETGAFTNFGFASPTGAEAEGNSVINANNNTFVVIGVGPKGGVNAEGAFAGGGSTINSVNNNFFVFPVETVVKNHLVGLQAGVVGLVGMPAGVNTQLAANLNKHGTHQRA